MTFRKIHKLSFMVIAWSWSITIQLISASSSSSSGKVPFVPQSRPTPFLNVKRGGDSSCHHHDKDNKDNKYKREEEQDSSSPSLLSRSSSLPSSAKNEREMKMTRSSNSNKKKKKKDKKTNQKKKDKKSIVMCSTCTCTEKPLFNPNSSLNPQEQVREMTFKEHSKLSSRRTAATTTFTGGDYCMRVGHIHSIVTDPKDREADNGLIELPVSLSLQHDTSIYNPVPISTFLDTGAQVTVMTLKAAKIAGIAHLLDRRYAGHATGVAGVSCRVLGRIPANSVTFVMGGEEGKEAHAIKLSPAIMVLEDRMLGHDRVEMLLGLDALEDWQAMICLRDRTLTVRNGCRMPKSRNASARMPYKKCPEFIIPFVNNSAGEEWGEGVGRRRGEGRKGSDETIIAPMLSRISSPPRIADEHELPPKSKNSRTKKKTSSSSSEASKKRQKSKDKTQEACRTLPYTPNHQKKEDDEDEDSPRFSKFVSVSFQTELEAELDALDIEVSRRKRSKEGNDQEKNSRSRHAMINRGRVNSSSSIEAVVVDDEYDDEEEDDEEEVNYYSEDIEDDDHDEFDLSGM